MTYQKLRDQILGFGKELLWKFILQFDYFLENQVLVPAPHGKAVRVGGWAEGGAQKTVLAVTGASGIPSTYPALNGGKPATNW